MCRPQTKPAHLRRKRSLASFSSLHLDVILTELSRCISHKVHHISLISLLSHNSHNINLFSIIRHISTETFVKPTPHTQEEYKGQKQSFEAWRNSVLQPPTKHGCWEAWHKPQNRASSMHSPVVYQGDQSLVVGPTGGNTWYTTNDIILCLPSEGSYTLPSIVNHACWTFMSPGWKCTWSSFVALLRCGIMSFNTKN